MIVEKVRFARLKNALAGLLTHAFVGRAIGILCRDRITSRGVRIDTTGDIAPRVKAYLFWGMYESSEVRFVNAYLRRDLDVIELGSSLGFISCHLARRAHGRRLFCVEGNPALKERIAANLALNHASAECVLTAAVSYTAEEDGMITMGVGEDNLLSSVATHGNDGGNSVRVPACTLHALIDRFGVDDYTLVSDIEGAEAGILLHDAKALARCQQMIIELHDAEHDRREYGVNDLIRLALGHGFDLRARRGGVCVFERSRAADSSHGARPPIHAQP